MVQGRARVPRLLLASALCASLFVAARGEAAPKPTVAVFPFKVARVQVKPAVLDVLWQTLSTQIATGGVYLVVPADTLKSKLRAQKKKSYQKCYAERCRITIGQELAAQKALDARIARIGERCQVSLAVWDLRKAAAELAAAAEGSCDERGLLGSVKGAASKLLAAEVRRRAPAKTAPAKSRCPYGKVAVGQHCCWPGQDWGVGRGACMGKPKCPNGFLPHRTKGCRPGCSDAGKVLIGGRCCWPGQEWAVKAGRCVGKPTRCPKGRLVLDTSCSKPGNVSEHWVELPRGRFTMGSNSGNRDQRPVHLVTLRRFAMLRSEVTVRQYRACVEAKRCSAPAAGRYYTGRGDRGDDQPINGVSWYQARAFCAWIGGRLPSEAEWEYAARGAGKAWRFPWGNGPGTCSRGVFRSKAGDGCGRDGSWSVCSKPGGNTAQGLCDMAGNLWEWTEDCHHPNYHRAPADNAPRSRCWSPSGTRSSTKVARGGGWDSGPLSAQTTHRIRLAPSARFHNLGFRCARDIP